MKNQARLVTKEKQAKPFLKWAGGKILKASHGHFGIEQGWNRIQYKEDKINDYFNKFPKSYDYFKNEMTDGQYWKDNGYISKKSNLEVHRNTIQSIFTKETQIKLQHHKK